MPDAMAGTARSAMLVWLFRAGLLLTVLLAGARAEAQPAPEPEPPSFEQLLPLDTLAYFELNAVSELPAALQQLGVWSVPERIQEIAADLEAEVNGAFEAELGLKKDAVDQLLGSFQSLHLGLIGVNAREQKPVILLGARLTDPAPLRALLDGPFAEQLKAGFEYRGTRVYGADAGGDTLFLALVDSRLFVAFDRQTIRKAVYDATSGVEHPLAVNPGFRAVREAYGERDLWGFVNPQAVLDTFKQFLSERETKELDLTDQIVELRDLRTLAFASSLGGTEGYPTEIEARLKEGNAIYAMLHTAPLDPELLRFMPATAMTGFAATVESGEATWGRIQAFIEKLDEEVFKQQNGMSLMNELAEMRAQLGFDVAEACAAVRGGVGFWVTPGSLREPGVTFAFQVADAAAARALLDRARQQGPLFQQLDQQGEIQSISHDGVEIIFFRTGSRGPGNGTVEGPGFAILEGTVLFSSAAAELRAAIDARRGKIPSAFDAHGESLKQFPSVAKVLIGSRNTFADSLRPLHSIRRFVAEDKTLALASVESEGSLKLVSNLSLFEIGAVLGATLLHQQAIAPGEARCWENLEAIQAGIRRHTLEKGSRPPNLETLVPSHVARGGLSCPLDPEVGYRYFQNAPSNSGGLRDSWGIVLVHCRSDAHPPVFALAEDGMGGGRTWSGLMFRRFLTETERLLEPASGD